MHPFGRGHRGFSGWSKAKRELDVRIGAARGAAGIDKPMLAWRLHDLRRSFVTHINERGFGRCIYLEQLGVLGAPAAGPPAGQAFLRVEIEQSDALALFCGSYGKGTGKRGLAGPALG